MGIPLYLAMTASELSAADSLPERIGWMACHFSAYGSGLSNFPASLPPDSLLIVNDRIPIFGHDPAVICKQIQKLLTQFDLKRILLDFQRPGEAETETLVAHLTQQLPCITAVSEGYAGKGDYPVFLPPPALHCPLNEYLQPWKGREIWLEAATACAGYTVTQEGCRIHPELFVDDDTLPHEDNALHCRYGLEIQDTSAHFLLQRGKKEVDTLLKEAQALGVTAAVGLFQDLG